MKFHIMLASAAIVAMTGSALAQESGGATGGTQQEFTSAAEEGMYTRNMESMGGFFTDDTMTTMVEEDAFSTNWEALSADQQTQLREDCELASENRADYSEVSVTFCSQVGAFE